MIITSENHLPREKVRPTWGFVWSMEAWPNGIIFHQPRFHWNKGISLTEPPFGVRSNSNYPTWTLTNCNWKWMIFKTSFLLGWLPAAMLVLQRVILFNIHCSIPGQELTTLVTLVYVLTLVDLETDAFSWHFNMCEKKENKQEKMYEEHRRAIQNISKPWKWFDIDDSKNEVPNFKHLCQCFI